MPSREAEGVVLRQYSLSEADRIIVFFTREYGKLRAVGQGVKRPKNRLGGCLEPLNLIHLHFYLKEGADLARIEQCETIHSYLGKHPSLARVYSLSYVTEVVQELIQENYPNPLLYRLFLSTLNAAEKLGPGEGLLRYFEFWALRLSGVLPDYDYCSKCGKCVKGEGFFAWLEAGQGRCRTCAQDAGMRIGPAAAKLLRQISELSPEQFVAGPWDAQVGRDLERLSQRLLELHLEKRLKSYKHLKEMLRET